MDQEIIRYLRTLTELTEENNKILHSLQRSQRWSNFFSWVKWLIIIAITLGSYIVIQPYLDDATKKYQGIKGFIDSIPSFEQLKNEITPGPTK